MGHFTFVKRGHFYFGEIGHFYFALTSQLKPLDRMAIPRRIRRGMNQKNKYPKLKHVLKLTRLGELFHF
jgi:hypothetical protein